MILNEHHTNAAPDKLPAISVSLFLWGLAFLATGPHGHPEGAEMAGPTLQNSRLRLWAGKGYPGQMGWHLNPRGT